MDRIEIYWGADKDFEEATEKLEDVHFLVDVVISVSTFLASVLFPITSL